jgi:hypothetical protein
VLAIVSVCGARPKGTALFLLSLFLSCLLFAGTFAAIGMVLPTHLDVSPADSPNRNWKPVSNLIVNC